ncbi:transmembrane protein, putative (macronuclear) [Tetrahymena thermophila SB210]|uniref:Transmembrane protein, putative n=1 Tax=Tetrahymena thermophila (strain SB210) TaxID=312017 RepID=W7XG53_TETTS|nr:transmembrane protein, putative [Tetrahymena thermophila SB210]EWS71809.1 transmembrane protein, putative [Tetrahymena thermophila SB210]|eukprot:XP_012655696.1 transmembrane protein, putative [Tetrahymena thermophila SB210]
MIKYSLNLTNLDRRQQNFKQVKNKIYHPFSKHQFLIQILLAFKLFFCQEKSLYYLGFLINFSIKPLFILQAYIYQCLHLIVFIQKNRLNNLKTSNYEIICLIISQRSISLCIILYYLCMVEQNYDKPLLQVYLFLELTPLLSQQLDLHSIFFFVQDNQLIQEDQSLFLLGHNQHLNKNLLSQDRYKNFLKVVFQVLTQLCLKQQNQISFKFHFCKKQSPKIHTTKTQQPICAYSFSVSFLPYIFN